MSSTKNNKYFFIKIYNYFVSIYSKLLKKMSELKRMKVTQQINWINYFCHNF